MDVNTPTYGVTSTTDTLFGWASRRVGRLRSGNLHNRYATPAPRNLEAISERAGQAKPARADRSPRSSLIVMPPCSIRRNASLFDFARPAITTSSVFATPAVNFSTR